MQSNNKTSLIATAICGLFLCLDCRSSKSVFSHRKYSTTASLFALYQESKYKYSKHLPITTDFLEVWQSRFLYFELLIGD